MGIQLATALVEAIDRNMAKDGETNRSQYIERLLCQSIGFHLVQDPIARKTIEQQQAEIERLKQELEATRRRQKLATVPSILEDKFTLENG